MKWFETKNETSGATSTVVSSRVRLARNLEDYPFEPRLDEPSAREILERAGTIFTAEKGYCTVDFGKITPLEKQSMAEMHLVSPEFAAKSGPHALYENEEKSVYVMALEEDHFRIQCVLPGLCLDEAYRRAAEADDLLDGGARIAYSEKLGYLTHCPTNLGTGMRASVMMFLPALTAAGQIGSLGRQLSKIGLTVRGMSGEGSEGDGCLYQISNQVTLGISEEETLKKLESVVKNITDSEEKLRAEWQKRDGRRLSDRVRRAWGVLSWAEMLTSAELLSLYADVRLGASLGLLDADPGKLDSMAVMGMPATVTLRSDGVKSAEDRDAARAALVRKALGG